MTTRAVLVGGVAFRVVFPLLVLAAAPGRLAPGLPSYRYDPLVGDAYGYYYGAREILATLGREAPVIALVVVAAAAAAAALARKRPVPEAAALAVAGWAAAVAAVLAWAVRGTGTPQFGWPLLWSVPLLPLRLAGVEPTPDRAYAAGLALSLVANAVTVVATYLLARSVFASRTPALLASALFALWPLLLLLTGPDAPANGTWIVDLGLAMYTEPVATALVTVAVCLALRRARDPRLAVLCGTLLGVATLVRVANVLVVGCVLAVHAVWREWGRARAVALGAAVWAPAVLLYWPKGYPSLGPPTFPDHPFSLSYAHAAWTESTVWRPLVLLLLVPLAACGAVVATRRGALLLGLCIASTAVFYTFYTFTPTHPRFLFVVLPAALVLCAGGAFSIVARAGHAYHRRL